MIYAKQTLLKGCIFVFSFFKSYKERGVDLVKGWQQVTPKANLCSVHGGGPLMDMNIFLTLFVGRTCWSYASKARWHPSPWFASPTTAEYTSKFFEKFCLTFSTGVIYKFYQRTCLLVLVQTVDTQTKNRNKPKTKTQNSLLHSNAD